MLTHQTDTLTRLSDLHWNGDRAAVPAGVEAAIADPDLTPQERLNAPTASIIRKQVLDALLGKES